MMEVDYHPLRPYDKSICIALLSSEFPESVILEQLLAGAGIECEGLEVGGRLLECGSYDTFDLLLVRKRLDDIDGIDLIRLIKSLTKRDVPILFWSDEDDEDELVEVLSAGADDYLRPPFRGRELLARVLALCRRVVEKTTVHRLRVAGYELNRSQNRVLFHGREIPLTSREFEIAWLLFSNPDRTLASRDLQLLAWGKELPRSSRALSVLISRLRCALELTSEGDIQILTSYANGYRLVIYADSQARKTVDSCSSGRGSCLDLRAA